MNDIDIMTRYAFRESNLIRHHFVKLPLINYTKYSGPLISDSVDKRMEIDLDKIALSPRFVNFDECMMLVNSGAIKLNGNKNYIVACEIYKTINGNAVQGITWEYAVQNEAS